MGTSAGELSQSYLVIDVGSSLAFIWVLSCVAQVCFFAGLLTGLSMVKVTIITKFNFPAFWRVVSLFVVVRIALFTIGRVSIFCLSIPIKFSNWFFNAIFMQWPFTNLCVHFAPNKNTPQTFSRLLLPHSKSRPRGDLSHNDSYKIGYYLLCGTA